MAMVTSSSRLPGSKVHSYFSSDSAELSHTTASYTGTGSQWEFLFLTKLNMRPTSLIRKKENNEIFQYRKTEVKHVIQVKDSSG